MITMYRSLLLFLLNWLDAQLTLVWIKFGMATEGNELMALLLTSGDNSFLLVKICIGAAAALILYHWSHLPVAQKGLRLTLGIYFALMLVHVLTPLSTLF
ncbi:MAG: DUF5658 family protein [Pyrinomonadaceae bacterium]